MFTSKALQNVNHDKSESSLYILTISVGPVLREEPVNVYFCITLVLSYTCTFTSAL